MLIDFKCPMLADDRYRFVAVGRSTSQYAICDLQDGCVEWVDKDVVRQSGIEVLFLRLEYGVDITIKSDYYKFSLHCKQTIHGYCTVNILNLYVYDSDIKDLVIEVPSKLFGMRVCDISNMFALFRRYFLKSLILNCECSYCNSMRNLFSKAMAESIKLVFKFDASDVSCSYLLSNNRYVKTFEIINETDTLVRLNPSKFCENVPKLVGIKTRGIEFEINVLEYCLLTLKYIVTDSENIFLHWVLCNETTAILFDSHKPDALYDLVTLQNGIVVEKPILESDLSNANILSYLLRCNRKTLVPVIKV